MDDEPPSAGQLHAAIVEEQLHLLDAAMVKLRNCFDQLSVEQLWWRPAPDQNSIANLVLHVCGNLTQWIICGVGVEPDQRDREAEFATRGDLDGSELTDRLNQTLTTVADTIRKTDLETMLSRRSIQGFDVTGVRAIVHSVSHFVGHTHQIIQLTRFQLGTSYKFAWSPDKRDDKLPI